MSTAARVRFQILIDVDVVVDADESLSLREMKERAVKKATEPMARVYDAIRGTGTVAIDRSIEARAVDVALPSLASSVDP